MKDEYYEIGETAGKIYRYLQQEGEQAASKVQKAIEVSDSAVFNQALGWLAREEKLTFSRSGKAAKIGLCGVCSKA